MEYSTAFYVVTGAAIVMTGFSKSGFGGGLGVMSVPLMSLFIAPQVAVAILMPILITMDVFVVYKYRKHFDHRVVLTLLTGGLIGLFLGTIAFTSFSPDLVRFFIGALALFFVTQFVLLRRSNKSATPQSAWTGASLGVLSGFSSYVAHAGGPPVKGYLLRQGLDKTTFVGTNTLFFFTLNAFKVVAYGSTGIMDANTLKTSVILAPCLFVGLALGSALHRHITQEKFTLIVYVFLSLTAVKLLSDSIPALIASLQ